MPEEIKDDGARLPRRRAGEPQRTSGSTRTPASCAELLAELGAIDVYVLPRGVGAGADRGAREGVLDRPRRAAPTTSSTSSCPGRPIPQYMAKVHGGRRRPPARSIVGCGHAGDGNVHLSVFQPDPEVRTEVLRRRCSRPAWRSAARSPASTASAPRRRSTSLDARGPGQARPHAPHQGGVRPRRDPQPRRHLRLSRRPTDERCPGPHPHARRRRRRRLLHEPGHVGDALRRRARRRARDARRARRCSRASPPGAADGYAPHGRPAGRHAAAPRPRPRQRPRQPAQRPQGASRPIVNIVGDHATYHKQYDAQLESRHRDRRAQRVELDPLVADSTEDGRPATRPTPSPRRSGPPGQVATLILPADVSWSDGGDAAAAGRAAPAAAVDADARRGRWRRCCARRRAGGAARSAGGACRADALRRRQPRSPTRPAPSSSPRRSPPGSSAAPAGRRSTASPTSPSSPPMQLDGAAPPGPRRREVAGVVLRLPGQGQRPRARRAARSTCSPAPDGDPAAALERARRRGRRRRRRRHPAAGRAARSCPPGALTADARLPDRRRPAARGRHRLRRGQHVGPVRRRPHRRRARPRLALPHRRRHRPGPAGRRRRGGRLPRPAGDRPPGRRQAMYTLQSLWTMAREELDVTTILFNNRPTRSSTWSSSRVGADAPAARRRRRCSTSTARPRLRRPRHRHGRPGHPGHDREELRRPARATPSPPGARRSSRPSSRRSSDCPSGQDVRPRVLSVHVRPVPLPRDRQAGDVESPGAPAPDDPAHRPRCGPRRAGACGRAGVRGHRRRARGGRHPRPLGRHADRGLPPRRRRGRRRRAADRRGAAVCRAARHARHRRARGHTGPSRGSGPRARRRPRRHRG